MVEGRNADMSEARSLAREEPASAPIRVLVAEDDPQLRAALTDLLSDEPGLHVVGAAADADEAISMAAEHAPDVAILDVRMPRGGGTRAAAHIRKRSPRTRILALSADAD